MIEVIPGINDSSWQEIEKKINLCLPFVSWLQIDFSDGQFVPRTSFLDPKPFAAYAQRVNLEAHLMVIRPADYVANLAAAGFKRVIGHLEAMGIEEFLAAAKEARMEVGLAIDGPTPVSLIEPYLDRIDTVLIMMAVAGPSNLELHKEHLEKIRWVKKIKPELPIGVDEGINSETAKFVIEAGATRLASTSFLFSQPEKISANIDILKNAAL